MPVSAHPLEHPYLNGDAAYPPPDPSVGGGLLARLSPLFPRASVNVSAHLRALPENATIPRCPDGAGFTCRDMRLVKIALWREADRSLIAADAFVTTAQESIYAVVTQTPKVHGPIDWERAKPLVETLARLGPEIAITGHGHPLCGALLRDALHALVRDFDTVAVPAFGRYVDAPARSDDGSAYAEP